MLSHRILAINPNSTQSMTDALKPVVHGLGYSQTSFDFFTAPSGPPSINDDVDAQKSAEICFTSLSEDVKSGQSYDGYLVACYSVHPLVAALRDIISPTGSVIGIFEASVSASLQCLGINNDDRFGIVSTGKIWEELLTSGVDNFLNGPAKRPTGSFQSDRFAGVETTGLSATELHDAPPEEVEQKVKEATTRLLTKPGGKVRAICLGCAGMVGMERWIRDACVSTVGSKEASQITIVDGVKAGIGALETMIRLKT